jgi:GT2 family glycosyltransferase
LDFSIVIPTYQRRDVVVASVKALAAQDLAGSFEVVVVVDGSRNGTAAALRRLIVPFPFVVLEQPNRGAATARNAGAAAASGRILLFLDDDMEADPRLLSEHVRSLNEGADVVFGHLPLHPESPSNFLSAGVKLWTDGRLERLSAPGAALTLHDLLTGQMSLRRELFNRMGGFDPAFTAGGTFGDEDIDFGYRLVQAGYRLVFNERAISWQKYVVQPREYLRQWRQAGRADVAFARKHPQLAQTVFDLNGAAKLSNRLLWRPLASCQPLTAPLMNLLRWLALALVACWGSHPRIVRFFFQIWAMEYWRGVQEAGGMPRTRAVRVLS